MLSIAKGITVLLLFIALPVSGYAEGIPESLKPLYKAKKKEGKRNFVLNAMEIGVEALKLGDIERATLEFDHALSLIETVYANDKNAAKARSLWYDEGAKDFKGESYERAMAYYYRALLYLINAEYDNAYASMNAGLFQDQLSEEEEYQQDFALLMLIQGWAATKMGRAPLADEAYADLKKVRPKSKRPSSKHNLLVLVETGKSPRKLGDGVGHYELVYRRGKKFTEQKAAAYLPNESSIKLTPVEDIYWQAATRGGRMVDRVIEGKVNFRNNTNKIGDFASNVGGLGVVVAPIVQSSSDATAGLAGLSVLGAGAKWLAARAKVKADTRYWSNLPDKVHYATMNAPRSWDKISVTYYDDNGAKVEGLDRHAKIYWDKHGNGVAWVKSR